MQVLIALETHYLYENLTKYCANKMSALTDDLKSVKTQKNIC